MYVEFNHMNAPPSFLHLQACIRAYDHQKPLKFIKHKKNHDDQNKETSLMYLWLDLNRNMAEFRVINKLN